MNFGRAVLARLRSWGRLGRFAGLATVAAATPSTYDRATLAVALRQIYFTAWQVLPFYVLFAALFSFIIIEIVASSARQYGLSQYALELVLRVLVLELIPLLTALFVALRSGAAIGTEVALMRVTGELEQIEAAGKSPLQREFVPRIVAAALSVASLTVVSSAVALLLAYVAMYGLSPWGLEEYTRSVGKVFDAPALIGYALKCALFGLAVALIPIAAGLEAVRERVKSAPVAVLGGLVKLFFVLGLIEVLSLAAKYV